jgi:hypothetical protein
MKIDHIEEIQALVRAALGEEPKAKSLTKAIVKATEFWHQEARDELCTKADLHQELHAMTRQFVTWMGAMTVIILSGVYFFLSLALSDIKNDIREIRTHLSAPQK